MADDLLTRLDEAAVTLLDRALASESLTEATEGFKLAVSWLERRAKLQPTAPAKGPTKFDALKGKLNGDGTSKRRGNRASAPEADPPGDLDA